MISPMYLGLLVLLIAYTKTDALQAKGADQHQCYQCHESWCDPGALLTAPCPPEKPHCATIASAPNFTSSLTCAAAVDQPCSLTYSNRHFFEMLCTCRGILCNAPFSKNLQNKLLTFVKNTVASNDTDFTDQFLISAGISLNDTFMYEKITVEVEETKGSTSGESSEGTERPRESTGIPRAEALKQEATVPNDDDEDEGEGSGLDDEPHASQHPGDAPSAPSSYLPADNSAPLLQITVPLVITTFLHIVL